MKFSKNDWQKPLAYTFLLYVFIYLIFFLLPGFLTKKTIDSNDTNVTKTDIKSISTFSSTSIRNHIIFYEPFNSLSPIGIGNWKRVFFPVKISEIDDLSLVEKMQNYNRIKNGPNVEELKEVVLSDFINSENNKIGFISSLLLRIGRLLFGVIQFLMIFFYLWMRIKYKKSNESYKKELMLDLESLNNFISKFGIKNKKGSFDINLKIRQLDDKLEKTTIEPNDLLDQELTNDKLYNLENSIIRDFYMKGKDSSLQRLNHVSEQLELVHENKIRWLEWALFIIPTVGFIGTVVGISDALGNTSLIFTTSAEQAIPIISTKLALAFDTTLLALLSTAIMYSWKRSLDNTFFNDFLHDFNSFNYSWITSSFETKEIEKVEKKQREFTNYVSKLLEVFGDVNSKLKEVVDVSKKFENPGDDGK